MTKLYPKVPNPYNDSYLNIQSYRTKQSVSVGATFSCGTNSTGKAYCWGQTDHKDVNFVSLPIVDISVSHSEYNLVCVLQTSGKVYCWSLLVDSYGRFISRALTTNPSDSFVQLSTKGIHTCALKSNTKVACWGSNHDEQTNVPDLNYIFLLIHKKHVIQNILIITLKFQINLLQLCRQLIHKQLVKCICKTLTLLIFMCIKLLIYHYPP